MGRRGDAERIGELMVRKALARRFVVELMTVKDSDPRAPEAIAHYEAQEAEINAKIAELLGGAPPVVVGLKTATISAEAQS